MHIEVSSFFLHFLFFSRFPSQWPVFTWNQFAMYFRREKSSEKMWKKTLLKTLLIQTWNDFENFHAFSMKIAFIVWFCGHYNDLCVVIKIFDLKCLCQCNWMFRNVLILSAQFYWCHKIIALYIRIKWKCVTSIYVQLNGFCVSFINLFDLIEGSESIRVNEEVKYSAQLL